MSMKDLKVDELEENIDELEEVVEDVFPALVATVVISAFILLLFLLRLYIRWSVSCPSKNKMDGKTVIITGANTGLGKATAVELAKRGARLVLGVREKMKGEAVARYIKKKTGNQNVFASQIDLGSFNSIRDFVEDFNSKEPQLHVLINNAAYMGPKATTAEGLERCFGVNHLGHFYLTYLLKDKLIKFAPSRIINVVSDSYMKGKLDLDDLALTKGYDIYGAYARSKTAQTVFNVECHRHFFCDVVMCFSVHPGAVCTDLLRNWPGVYGNFLRVMSRILFKSPEDGCQTIVFCAVADGIKKESGRVFANCKHIRVKDFIRDKMLGRKLWNISLQLCGLEPEIPDEEEVVTPTKPNDTEVKSREQAVKSQDKAATKLPQSIPKAAEQPKKQPEPAKKPPELVKKIPEPTVKKAPEPAPKPPQPAAKVPLQAAPKPLEQTQNPVDK